MLLESNRPHHQTASSQTQDKTDTLITVNFGFFPSPINIIVNHFAKVTKIDLGLIGNNLIKAEIVCVKLIWNFPEL